MIFTPDAANGLFEFLGGFCNWFNVRAYLRDKCVRGVSWPTTAFYSGWGIWNLYYYPFLDQWLSFAGGVFLTSANLVWVGLVVRDKLTKYYANPGSELEHERIEESKVR